MQQQQSPGTTPQPRTIGPDVDASYDAIVVGGGIAGLVAAYTLRGRGLRTLVLESADRTGGPVHGAELGTGTGTATGPVGLVVDVGAESFAARGTAVGELATELGLTVVEPAPLSAWGYAAGRAFPLPSAGVLGIPSVPWARDVRAAIGWPGVLRAGLDRVLPRRRADRTNLETFVRSRMGRRVADRLVAPVATGVHSAPLDHLDVDTVAPGLRAAYEREGSLGRAVAALRAQAPAGSAVRGIDGGMHRLVAELERAATAGGTTEAAGNTDAARPPATILTGHPVVAIERVPDDEGGGWTVGCLPLSAELMTFRAPRLIVTTPGVVPLLAPLTASGSGSGPVPTPEPGADVRLVTLLVRAPELDAAPRGSGLLVAPADGNAEQQSGAQVQAKALTHSTAKWPWLAAQVRDAVGPGHHVVRLSYGRIGATVEPTPEQAARDASHLLEVPLEGRVVDHVVTRWNGSLPPPTPAYRREVAAFSAQVDGVAGLGVTGSWIAGTGLAAVVAHAQKCAQES